LLLVLRKYDPVKKEGYHSIIDIPEGSLFETENGRIFRKGEKRRKRFTCTEIKTGLQYTFSPISEVKIVKAI